QLVRHLRELTTSLEAQARRVAPNLSAVVGPVVAAHLIAAAGGLEPLSRMDASRIQLLGARRRFGPGRSPRFGIMYHTEGMSQVPADRSGALARSAAALAAIAIRADATSGRSISGELVRRRERRIAQLNGRAS
ncbi:MAG: C/D box methylation guide ribonucleoprotein complex aNOP56 subunit, partial [Thermoplasmata archaeon]